MRSRIILALLTIAAFSVPWNGADAPAGCPAPARLDRLAAVHQRAGQPRFALDLVEAALGRIGVNANTKIVEPAQFTPSLLTGRVRRQRRRLEGCRTRACADVLAAVPREPAGARRPERQRRLGHDAGSPHGQAGRDRRRLRLRRAVDDARGPDVRAVRSEEDSLAQLLAEQVDYTLMDELVVQYILEQPREGSADAPAARHDAARHAARCIWPSRRSVPTPPSIIDRFNAQLRSMIADRTYHRLLHVDWISADVDGDGVAEFVPRTIRPARRRRSAPIRCSSRPEAGDGQHRFAAASTSAASDLQRAGGTCRTATRSRRRARRIRASRRSPRSGSAGSEACSSADDSGGRR